MPKSLDVSPDRFQQVGTLSVGQVPLYQYATSLEQERSARGDAELVDVLRRMLVIREFETMLAQLRGHGEYAGISFAYRGPAHLSVGQEAVSVGAALSLQPDDHIFGSHRSHGEFIAKGQSAIRSLGNNTLNDLMAGHGNGQLLQLVEQTLGGADVLEVAEHFLLLGLLSEIFMRDNGFNGGMGGSMHAFFPPFGAYPNNAIVGASAGIATGAALRKRLAGNGQNDSIAVALSGDGSTGCGPVWEAMNFAAMGQLDTLWDEPLRGGLPVLFLFTNNFYAMGGQTIGETMAWDRLSRIGLGVNKHALHAETVDGTQPLAVADAVARQRQRLLAGEGPALLDVECYRQSGHSTSDANAYRSREEIKAWQEHDAIARYADSLATAGLLRTDQAEQLSEDVQALMCRVLRVASDPALCPPVDIVAAPTRIGDLMFADTDSPAGPGTLPETSDGTVPTTGPDADALAACARVRQNRKKARYGLDDQGKALSPMRAITLRDALFEPVLEHLLHDERLIVYGEECREWGGAFGVYRGLSDLFPHHRVFNSPISEAAIVATAVGYALEGGRALVELMYADFIGRAGDEIMNQMAKWHAMSGGLLSVPVVLRCSVGSKYGAQHSQDWSALLAHVPGLRVVYPATPYDAKGLMASALASDDPVVVFESQRLYDRLEVLHPDGVPSEPYQIEFGEPQVVRTGDDVTVLTIGPSLYAALDAVELVTAMGKSLEIIDARSLVPFNYQPVIDSVRRTGHLLIVCEACERGSFAMTLASNVSRFAFEHLKQAPRVLGCPNWIVPGAEMESTYFPQAGDIVDLLTREWWHDVEPTAHGVRGWDDLDLARRGL